MKSRPLTAIKSKLVSDRSRVRRIPFGLFKGQRLDINFRFQSQIYFGLCERETYGVIRRASQNAEWFVDVGAGRGELCILFAALPRVHRLVAIEPNDIEIASMLANLRHNNIGGDRVEILVKFAGTKRDVSYIELDQLDLNKSARGFIKIDVDGAEFDVLQSGKRLFAEGNVEVLVETHSSELEKICIEWLQAYGYSCEIIENAWWRRLIPEQRPIPHNRWLFATRPL